MRPSDDLRELGRITGSQDEHEWIGAPEEMLDALLNRPDEVQVTRASENALCRCDRELLQIADTANHDRSSLPTR